MRNDHQATWAVSYLVTPRPGQSRNKKGLNWFLGSCKALASSKKEGDFFPKAVEIYNENDCQGMTFNSIKSVLYNIATTLFYFKSSIFKESDCLARR